jgi:hypothetical protein
MIDDKGNVWSEDHYDGYGTFGGKDFYELLAEMNGMTSDLTGDDYVEDVRMKGIELAFRDNPSGIATPGVKYPNLIEMAKGWQYDPMGPDNCEFQGYFYDEDEWDDDISDWDSTLSDGLEND